MSTGTIADARMYWAPPTAPPKPTRGLFSVADVLSFPDPHFALGVEYQTNRCTSGEAWLDLCDPAATKNFADLSLVSGYPFAVYDALECTIGMDQGEREAMLRASFDAKAEAVAEGVLRQAVQDDSTTDVLETDLLGVIASLELELGNRYAGQGVMHLDRSAATYASSMHLLYPDGDVVRTITGTPVVLGRGYGAGLSAATGWVGVLRGPLNTYMAPQTTTDPARVVAEQQYVLLLECPIIRGAVGV